MMFPRNDFTVTESVIHCNTETDLIFPYQLISFNGKTYDQTLKGSTDTTKIKANLDNRLLKMFTI